MVNIDRTGGGGGGYGGGGDSYDSSADRPESKHRTSSKPEVYRTGRKTTESEVAWSVGMLLGLVVFLIIAIISFSSAHHSGSKSGTEPSQSSPSYQDRFDDDTDTQDDCLKGTSICNVKGLNFHKGF